MILGKFLPPHQGHVYLVNFALNHVERLTVLVCTLESEPIPGRLRWEWMREMFPQAEVIHFTDENPQEPHEHPDFWRIWHDTIRKVLPEGPDFLFASESYGVKLADALGARFIPVDPARALVPTSGTAIRDDPLGNWDFIPACVRPWFVKRICIFGPESTGKSILAARLASHYRTVHVSEYARGLIELQGDAFTYEDIDFIARGQIASEDALARQANRILICDTDLITTSIWSDVFFGDCHQWILDEADRRKYDLYLLMDIDVPWVDDPQRYLPDARREFLDRCRMELERRNRPYVLISGDWEERYQKACRAIDDLI